MKNRHEKTPSLCRAGGSGRVASLLAGYNTPKLPNIRSYDKGLHVAGYSAHIPPSNISKRGEVKDWSRGSRRRMRRALMRLNPPDGWSTVSLDLTVPPLASGSDRVTIDQEETKLLWKRFCDRLNRDGLASVWRLEIQQRQRTKRRDIRGIPQPHWHLILCVPPGYDLERLRSHWLSCLQDRGHVAGAGVFAVNVSFCDDWISGRMRYILDHASKSKAEQVANGWGRHWGVTGRKVWVEDLGENVDLSEGERVWLFRLLRRGLARRVKDKRGVGGVNPARLIVERVSCGARIIWMGGSMFVDYWDGSGRMPRAVKHAITQIQGKAGKNVWALKKGHYRASSGYFWVDAAAYVRAARIMGQNEEKGGQNEG